MIQPSNRVWKIICLFCSQKYNLNWDLYQLREVWTKYFKTSPVEEDDVEMTREGEGSVDPSRDEDDCEKLICLANESRHLGGMSKYRLSNLRSGYWKN